MMFAMLLDRINQLENAVHNQQALQAGAPQQAPQPLFNPFSFPSQAVATQAVAAPQQAVATQAVAPQQAVAASKEGQQEKQKEISTDDIELIEREPSSNEDVTEDENISTLLGIGNSEQVAILARVSTPEQKASNRESLGCQVEACTEQMRKMGCKNAYLIRQIDESATRDGHQQEEFFDTVVGFRKHPVVFVRTITRFSRQKKLGLERLERIHQAGGRVIFGVPEDDGLVWYDSSTQRGMAKFEAQLSMAESWAKEMSITARDNARRKREREQAALEAAQLPAKRGRKNAPALLTAEAVRKPTPEEQQSKRITRQSNVISEALLKNNRDSQQLRRIIDWIQLARRGGSNTVVLTGLKDLINWNQWSRHPNYNEWRRNPWVFRDGATENPLMAQHHELTFDWIATNLREWRVAVPPIRGVANIRTAWTPELVERLVSVDPTDQLTRMIERM